MAFLVVHQCEIHDLLPIKISLVIIVVQASQNVYLVNLSGIRAVASWRDNFG